MSDPLKVLFLTYSDEEGACARYRAYQFFPYLRSRGMVVEARPFYSPAHYRLLMAGRGEFRQVPHMIGATLRRTLHVLRSRRADVVVFQREAVPLGPVILESLARRLGAGTIFDLDDATFVHNPDSTSWLRTRLRNPNRVSKVIASVDAVCAGNEFIGDYARRFNDTVEVIPGAEDMRRFDVEPLRHAPDRFVVGWIGSRSTEAYLNLLKPALTRLAEKIPNLSFVVIGGGAFACPGVDVVHLPWRLEDEVARVRGFDIGVMPLSDDEWSRGKCGGKGRMYMAAGVVSAVTPIGYNVELIEDGETGVLIHSPEQWFDRIYDLYLHPQKRRAIAQRGRAHVQDQLSVDVLAPRLESLIRRVARPRRW